MEPDTTSMSLQPSEEAGAFVAEQFAVSPHSPAQQRRRVVVLGILVALLASPFPVLRASTYRSSADLHATIEMAGAAFGLLAGFALIARFSVLRNRLHLLVGLAFFVNGAEDFVHGFFSLCGDRGWASWTGSSLDRFIPGTYASGRLLLGLILLGAPLLSRRLGRSTDPKRETVKTSFFVLLVAVAATTVAFLLPLPQFVFPGRVISRPVDFVSALVLSGALFAFVREYRRGGDAMVWWVALSIGINMVGQGMMSFSKALYDPFLDVSHVYKVLGYVVPLLGLSLYQIAILKERATAERELRRHRDSLEELVEQRTCELEARNQQLALEAAERARAAEALRASEEKYRGIVEHVQIGITLISRDMEILELNRTMRQWFPHIGPGERSICYRACNRPPRDEPCPYCPTIETLRDGKVHQVISETPAGNEVRNYRIIASPIRDASGKVVAAIEIMEDVTERERSVLALEESEDRYRALVGDMPALICRFTLDGVVNFVNDACCEYFGRTREDMIGRHLSEFLPEGERQAVKDNYGSLTPESPVTTYEHAVVGPDGSLRHQRWTNRLLCDEAGCPVEIQSVAIDITDRRKAEEALRDSEGKLNAMLGSVPDHMSMMDRDLNILWANETARMLFGDDIVGQKCYRVYHGRSEPCEPYPCPMLTTFEAGRPHEHDTEVLDKMGTRRYFHCTANVALRDRDGNPTAVIEISQDVTQQKLAEQELRQSQQKYYHLFHNLNDAAFLADVGSGELLDANKQAEVLLGRTPDEIIGMHQSELHPPGQAERYRAMFRRHIAQGHAADFDADVCRKDGSIVPVRISASLLNVGGRDCLLGLFHDLTERKQAEKELLLKTTLLEAQAETSLDGILAVDEEGRTILFNKRFGEMWDIPQEVLEMRDDEQMLHDVQDRLAAPEGFLARVEYLYEHPEVESRDEIELRDGRVFDRYSAGLMDTQRRYHGRIWYFRDITDSKRAEEKLRNSEQRFRGLAETTSDWVWEVDAEGVYTYASPQVEALLGYPPDEVVGKGRHDLVPPGEAERVAAEFRAILESQEPFDKLENTALHKDGRTVVLETSGVPFFDADGGFRGFRGIDRDVTDRKQAEQALLANEAQLSNAMEIAKLGYWEYDVADDMFTFNDHFYRIFRTTAEQVGGYRMSSAEYAKRFVHPDDAAVVAEETRKAIETTDPHYSRQLEHRIVYGDGKIGYIAVRFFIVKDSQGNTIKTYGANQDITEWRRTEEKRVALEAKVQHAQKLESMGVLAGGIAHDFNNLLTGVIGNAGLALMDLPADLPARHSIEEINVAARRAAELANQMLAYSGGGQFVVEPVDLSDLVRELQHLLGSAVSKRVTLEFDLADDLLAVEGDATQLRQVVMNLVINASEAIGDGDGGVTVRTCLRDADTSYLADSHVDDGLSSGPYVCLEVADTGCGMDEETKARLFDPFFSTKFTGRGLGLAAVLGIVRGHGGAIRVESKPGKGSTFRVLLPSCDATALELAEPEVVPDGGLRGHGTVLVVDDEEAIRQVSKSALARSGFTVLTAEDGPQAIEAVRADPGRVQAVLLDLTMPHMDAEEVVRELRRLRKDLPIILSSGYSEDEAVRRFAAGDLAGFIQKPYDPATLIQTLWQIMRGQPAH